MDVNFKMNITFQDFEKHYQFKYAHLNFGMLV